MHQPNQPRVSNTQFHLGKPHTGLETLELVPHKDKAISQRALILAAMAHGESRINDLAVCKDVTFNLNALQQLGIPLSWEKNTLHIQGTDFHKMRYTSDPLTSGNSATTSRLFIATLAGSQSQCIVTGNALLQKRPMTWLIEPLRQLGADLTYRNQTGCLPIGITGKELTGGEIDIQVDSAQAVSALLFAGLNATDTIILHRRTAARDHTERMLQWTGIDLKVEKHRLELVPAQPQAFHLTIPGDPSGAAVLASLHIAAKNTSPLILREVCLNPTRLGFFDIMQSLGAKITYQVDSVNQGPEPVGTIIIEGTPALQGGVIEGRELIQAAIDEIPLIAALSALGEGITIKDASELRDKDTDRIASTVNLLQAFGITAQATTDGLIVHPSAIQSPEKISFPPDHRIIFAGCVLALLGGGDIILEGIDAAAVSYPDLVDDIKRYAPLQEI